MMNPIKHEKAFTGTVIVFAGALQAFMLYALLTI